jgi:Putative lipoprotein GNA1162-like
VSSLIMLALGILLAGCASANNYEQRPFFQHEYDLQTHGRKTLLDRVVEVDPGGFDVYVSPDFERDPPARIAVLPFADEGSANFVVNRIPLTYRSKKDRFDWAWTDAQRLRRAMQGYLAQREFMMLNLYAVDAVIQDRGIDNLEELEKVPARKLGRWLGVDAVMYGTVVHYDAYYLFLVSGWNVQIDARLVSTHTGETLIRASGSRWDVSVLPALDVQDIAINSALNILQLRDINLARSEEEACREVVKRIPRSEKLVEAIDSRAREYADFADGDSDVRSAASEPRLIQDHPYPVILDPPGDAPLGQ